MNSRTTAMAMAPPANKGTANIFYKTRMCARFRLGACRNGEGCNFAHGIEDLRQPPSNWQELVGATAIEERDRDRERHTLSVVVGDTNSWDEDQKIIQRMKLCRSFCCGEECPYGDRCNFLHEDLAKYRDDSSKLRESSAISISIGNGGSDALVGNVCSSASQIEALIHGGPMLIPVPPPVPSSNANSNSNSNSKTVYWKTRLCMKFEMTGHCPFGDKCHFAHGQAELHTTVGRVEGEVRYASKLHTMTGNNALAAKATAQVTAASSSSPNEEARRKKCLFKWSNPKKINRIYADWIDDLPVGQTPTKPVEN
ncbi:PREDICTED: zinc finger CCCH domain-containing protein 39-like [Tarenaya hassleriana]|uniref:zinc finger CCCH domain-containing protein 39-like n=1 Tax=Tarenaya hassleriana TaxID=28532 RepID=UPI00053C69C3|nr:PREDICTED: zinc finger CCCH domain-containing protein 39-like [Tarenaya hassleriana]XP_010533178.1 PREDICTED: zinc finger CCCH domain-containing protein 39-like [Tarenaya hassleriana]